MNDMRQLEALRNSYREQISANEVATQRLKEKLAFVEEIIGDVNQLKFPGSTPEISNKYANVTLTNAVSDAVQKIGGNGGATATDIAKYLISNGFKNTGKWFLSSVILTLRRLAESDRIISEKIGTRRMFKAKA